MKTHLLSFFSLSLFSSFHLSHRPKQCFSLSSRNQEKALIRKKKKKTKIKEKSNKAKAKHIKRGKVGLLLPISFLLLPLLRKGKVRVRIVKRGKRQC